MHAGPLRTSTHTPKGSNGFERSDPNQARAQLAIASVPGPDIQRQCREIVHVCDCGAVLGQIDRMNVYHAGLASPHPQASQLRRPVLRDRIPACATTGGTLGYGRRPLEQTQRANPSQAGPVTLADQAAGLGSVTTARAAGDQILPSRWRNRPDLASLWRIQGGLQQHARVEARRGTQVPTPKATQQGPVHGRTPEALRSMLQWRGPPLSDQHPKRRHCFPERPEFRRSLGCAATQFAQCRRDAPLEIRDRGEESQSITASRVALRQCSGPFGTAARYRLECSRYHFAW